MPFGLTLKSASRLPLATILCTASIGAAACRVPRPTAPTPDPVAELPIRAGSLDASFLRLGVAIPTFSGMYWDQEAILRVRLQDLSAAEVARPQIWDFLKRAGAIADPSRIVFEQAKTPYTWAQIADFKDGMRDVLTLQEVTFLDADEICGCVSVGIANEGRRSAVEGFANQVGVPPDAVQTVIASARTPFQSVTDQFRPMVGGIQIKNDAGPFAFLGFAGICTLTTVAQRFAIAGIVSCSHCTRVMAGLKLRAFQNGRVPFSLDYIAHESSDPPWTTGPGCPTGRVCRRSDSAFAVIDIGNQNGAMGLVARPATLCVGTAPCTLSMPSPTAAIAIDGLAAAPLVGAVLQRWAEQRVGPEAPLQRHASTLRWMARPPWFFVRRTSRLSRLLGTAAPL